MIEWIKKATSRNISGNYKFYLKNDQQSIDTASTITVTPFTDRSETAIVPCHYKWFRIRNGLIEESYKFKGNSYVCDCADIGAVIQADVTSNDTEYSGHAAIQFGPVRLATQVKKHVMDALTNGSTFIKGMVCLGEYQQKQCQFKVFQDMVKICHLQSDLNYSFHFTFNQPKVENVPKDPSRIWITFSQNYESNPHAFMKNLFGFQYDQVNNINNQCKMQVKFPNRQVKDMFIMSLRAFYTKKQLKNSIIIHKIQSAQFNQQQVSLLYQIQSLRSDISRLYYTSENKQKQKQRLSMQVTRLQKQMEQIVSVYTRFADERMKSTAELNQSYATLTNKRDQVFGRKCSNLQKQNMSLNDRIKMLTAEIDQIRLNSSTARKNQTINQTAINGLNPTSNPNFTHITTIRMNSQVGGPNATSFHNVLQNLSESRVTDFNQSTFKANQQLQKANEQKVKLEKKLEQSFRTIDNLQKQLKNNQSNKNNTSAIVHFQKPEINTSSYSLVNDLQKVRAQNVRLVSANQMLKKQNKKLQMEVSNSGSRLLISHPNNASLVQSQYQNPNQISKISIRQNVLSAQNQGLKKQLNSIKNSSVKQSQLIKQNQGLKIQVMSLKQSLAKQNFMKKQNQSLKNQINYLKFEASRQSIVALQNSTLKKQNNSLRQSAVSPKQIQALKQQIFILNKNLKNQQIKSQKYFRQNTILQKKLEQLNNQIEMYKRNQQVLNRSQHLSMEMENYNQQKMNVLKQHNNLLLSENEKLSKACQKYMMEARENIQLRKQLLQLKQKLGPKLNPQKQTKSVLYGSKFNSSNQYSQIIPKDLL